ncbi:MAG: hypothetical protein V1777_04215 [Candidatus Micrarchaeota archaeon]
MVSTRPIVGKVKRKWVPTRPLSQAEHWQVRDWRKGKGSVRPDFVRLAGPEERLAKIVTRRTRFGPRIRLHQVGSVPETPLEERALEKVLAEMSSGARASPKKLQRLEAKAEVLQTSITLRKALGGRDPHVFHVLAPILLEAGLSSEKLRQYSRILLQNHYSKRIMSLIGHPTDVYKAIKFRLPNKQLLLPELERTLFESAVWEPETDHFVPFSMTSLQLVKKLGLNWEDVKHKNVINVTLQLLETAGLVKKMPLSIGPKGGAISVWTHAAHKNPRMDYPNAAWYILTNLRTGEKHAAQLYKQFTVKKGGKSYHSGNPESHYDHKTLDPAFKELQEKGLLQIHTERISGMTKRHGGARDTTVAKLTPLGQRLLNEHDSNQSLPEWGRKLLLGEKEN